MRDIPSGFTPKHWDTLQNGHAYPTVAVSDDDVVAVSDTGFMGVLTVIGVDPVSHDPELTGRRAWWLFAPEDNAVVISTAAAFYAACDGTPTKLSFVREAISQKVKFKDIAVSRKIAADMVPNNRFVRK